MPLDTKASTNQIQYKGLAQGIDVDGFARPVFLEQIVAKTAAYTVLATDAGATFTNKGATASVTFTLPAIAGMLTGWNVWFYQSALQAMVITAPSGKLIAYDNAAATSLTCSTTSKMGGLRIQITYDGALYMSTVYLANLAQVVTVS